MKFKWSWGWSKNQKPFKFCMCVSMAISHFYNTQAEKKIFFDFSIHPSGHTRVSGEKPVFHPGARFSSGIFTGPDLLVTSLFLPDANFTIENHCISN